MVLTKRTTTARNGTVEEVKGDSLVANGGTTANKKLKHQERQLKKLSIDLFRKSLRASKALPSLSFFALECLVSTAIIVAVVVMLLPLLFVYNVLKFIEAKVESIRTGATAMTGQDALWLQDHKNNRLIINSVMELQGDDVDKMVDGIRSVLTRCVTMKNDRGERIHPRFTKHIRKGIFQYFLKESTDFDVTKQVYKYEGEPPKSYEEMQELISHIYGEDLPFNNRPPWRFIVIPKKYQVDGALALFRLHHGLADGVSLTKFLALVFPDEPIVEKKLVKFSASDRMFMWVKAMLVASSMVIRKLFGSADDSIIHGCELSGVKKVAWSEPIDMQIIKRIKNKTGTTVNDVMMACVSMSFHDYFKSQGITDPPDVKAIIPVDVRAPDTEVMLENDFAVVSLQLPVSIKDMQGQLHTTKARMDTIKYSGEPFAVSGAGNFTVGYMPEFMTNLWNRPIANKHSLVLSNVPGPATSFTMAGHPVTGLFFWPPQRDIVGIGVGMYSYSGKVIIGVEGDVSVLPNPQAVVKIFKAKLSQLEMSVSQSTQTEVDSGIELH